MLNVYPRHRPFPGILAEVQIVIPIPIPGGGFLFANTALPDPDSTLLVRGDRLVNEPAGTEVFRGFALGRETADPKDLFHEVRRPLWVRAAQEGEVYYGQGTEGTCSLGYPNLSPFRR